MLVDPELFISADNVNLIFDICMVSWKLIFHPQLKQVLQIKVQFLWKSLIYTHCTSSPHRKVVALSDLFISSAKNGTRCQTLLCFHLCLGGSIDVCVLLYWVWRLQMPLESWLHLHWFFKETLVHKTRVSLFAQLCPKMQQKYRFESKTFSQLLSVLPSEKWLCHKSALDHGRITV